MNREPQEGKACPNSAANISCFFLLYFYLILQNMYVVPGMRFIPDFCGQSAVVCDLWYLSTFRVRKGT